MNFNLILMVLALSVSLISSQNDESFGKCRTPNQVEGECIYLQKCPDLLKVVAKNPVLPHEINYLRESKCGNQVQDGSILVCCESDPVPSGPTSPGNVLPQPGECGTGAADRVLGGNKTAIDEFRWMVLLEYTKLKNEKGFHCGGVLINNRYVLTAAHCINGLSFPSDWRLTGVRLGEWDLSTEEDCELDECSDEVVNISIEQTIPHENYKPMSKSSPNDIALIRLSQPVPYTDWISAICLPQNKNSILVGQKFDIAGWGITESETSSNIKLKARVDFVDLENCNKKYHKFNVTLSDGQLCAGGERGIDSCKGDSGGPLIGLDISNKFRPYFFLAGLVSFGPLPCGLEGWPAVYTKVEDYIDWIKEKIRP